MCFVFPRFFSIMYGVHYYVFEIIHSFDSGAGNYSLIPEELKCKLPCASIDVNHTTKYVFKRIMTIYAVHGSRPIYAESISLFFLKGSFN